VYLALEVGFLVVLPPPHLMSCTLSHQTPLRRQSWLPWGQLQRLLPSNANTRSAAAMAQPLTEQQLNCQFTFQYC